MEGRIIEYPRSSGLDYHHNSPLIGEIPTNDYTHFHRSIDQLRSLNERGILNTNHFQNVLVPASTSPIVVQASGVYSEIKLSDDYQSSSNKSMRRSGEEIMENESVNDEYHQKKEGNNFRIIHSPQQYSLTTTTLSPINPNVLSAQSVQSVHQQNTFVTMETTSHPENQTKSKVREEFLLLTSLIRARALIHCFQSLTSPLDEISFLNEVVLERKRNLRSPFF